jgi:hypothetical protein
VSVSLAGAVRRVRQPWRWLPFALRLHVARWRRWLIRRKVVRLVVWTAIITVGFLTVFGVVARAREIQSTWGPTHDVVAVRVDIAAGDVVDADDLILVSRPTGFSVDDVLQQIPPQSDIATRTLLAGDVVSRRDLRSTRPALGMPPHHLAISLPTGPTMPVVKPGDVVDLYLVPDAFGVATEAGPQSLDSPAVVMESSEDAVVLAVHEDDVGDVVGTTSSGRVIVALR